MESLSNFYSSNLSTAFSIIGHTFWYWLPWATLYIAYDFYWRFKRFTFLSNVNWMVLEVKLPREVNKSPRAFEIALNAFHNTIDGTWWDHIKTGKCRLWASLEMVSQGGVVRFFIRIPADFRNLIEAELYSQYPAIEIYEAPDYTEGVVYNGSAADTVELFGAELELTKEDAYPIRTYVDYGLDKDPKEEYKHDPMTPLLEALGTTLPGHQIWIQIIIQATKKRFPKKGSPKTLWGKTKQILFGTNEMQDWQAEGEALINKIMKRDEKPKEGEFKFTVLSASEKDVTEAIARSISKIGFDCGIRMLYLSPKGDFKPMHIGSLLGTWKQFNSTNLNGFKPAFNTSFQFPWQDITGRRLPKIKQEVFRAYRARGYFYPPFSYQRVLRRKRKPFVLNAEELATIYHFPGSVAETPTMERVASRKAEPPPNLPL